MVHLRTPIKTNVATEVLIGVLSLSSCTAVQNLFVTLLVMMRREKRRDAEWSKYVLYGQCSG
jgi:hypothetical protein